MKIENITPETMYEAIQNNILTQKAFMDWLAIRTNTTEPDVLLPEPRKRVKVTVPGTTGVAYIGQRNNGKSFDVRFEVDDYSVPERHHANFNIQRLNKTNVKKTTLRIHNLFKMCKEEGVDPRSSKVLASRVYEV